MWALVLLALAGAACSKEDRPGWNVIVVMVDTLRADHLSLYGYERPTSPFLEELAQESVVFQSSRSQAGCTHPSVNSLLTSRYPQEFLGQPEKKMGIPEGIPSLPEILSGNGYSTAAVSGSLIVRKNPSRHNPSGGFGRGFDRFDETCRRKNADCIGERAGEILGDLEEPFFLYLHYMEPHAPYQPPKEHKREFAGSGPVRKWAAQGQVWPIRRRLYQGRKKIQWDQAEIDRLIDLYDEEVLYLDGQLRLLVDELARTGQLDRSVFVFISDHGEELLGHGHHGHCRDLVWDSVMKTPFMIRFPGGEPAGVRHSIVQNLDLVPTLLDYLDIDAQGLSLTGKSLRPVIERDRPVHRAVFGAQGASRTVVFEGHKSIHDLASGEVELYDLAQDPGETSDLAEALPDLAARHQELLERWLLEAEGEIGREESLRRAEETRKHLEALGYL